MSHSNFLCADEPMEVEENNIQDDEELPELGMWNENRDQEYTCCHVPGPVDYVITYLVKKMNIQDDQI